VNLLPETQERLNFLVRVVSKEIKHLDYADSQAFGASLTLERVEKLEQDPALALTLEAFTSRFCRLQDTLGDKLLPALLNALGESANALLINLNKAEKYGWLDSAEEWISLRQLRNKMIHEYIEEAVILHSALTTAHQNVEVLKVFAENLMLQVQQLQE
jgi:uncharacterized protein with HEPN domain|tara:strand:+ start:359 stop:835 length:477 start_codon:yes stop_codon:yes gene_type:complete